MENKMKRSLLTLAGVLIGLVVSNVSWAQEPLAVQFVPALAHAGEAVPVRFTLTEGPRRSIFVVLFLNFAYPEGILPETNSGRLVSSGSMGVPAVYTANDPILGHLMSP